MSSSVALPMFDCPYCRKFRCPESSVGMRQKHLSEEHPEWPNPVDQVTSALMGEVVEPNWYVKVPVYWHGQIPFVNLDDSDPLPETEVIE